ncbi:MAG TPA: bifunctional diaminohydroxyphosphoribosylaminopyrimidine deaminase/5-amino-6-(5-phosphoribosylamino)uracil reductase RibD [Gammaproteobacteria bacterium]|nr:bifunctional diaminohydroxyphosphoribosylaminopyrimidine deaminase/5-amino-6-(5-phosphoribosylamino)uracil reductase RibD [Gammaproteobacteria bacterium]
MARDVDNVRMARALRLAERGRFSTRPNPRVGCVLTRAGVVVGEGWHERAGGPHAEVMALGRAGAAAAGSTAYVTLEPCSHHGRTAPCVDALRAAGVARVVVAMRDPNPLVAGRGLARLEAAGIDTTVGPCGDEARALNAGFVSRMERGRPRVRVKLAASLDGRTAMASGESRWITDEAARRDVHRLRAESGAVVTGIGTVLADDPSLNVRLDRPVPGLRDPRADWLQPLRVILDSGLRCPERARTLSLPGGVLVVTTAGAPPEARDRLAAAGAEVVSLPAKQSRPVLARVLELLAEREINDVLVEAGATLSGAFLQAGLTDELLLYLGPHLMGDAARGLVHLPGLARMADRIALQITDIRAVGRDWRVRARPVPGPGSQGE